MTVAARTPTVSAPADLPQFKERALALRLMGLLAHWDAVQGDPARIAWTGELLGWEESERARRSLERRLRSAHIGRFKPLADFDWDWPKSCNRAAVQELMTLSFMTDATNVVLVGPNGVGKSMLACNLGHQALIEGKTVLFTTAGQLLGDLAALDSDSLLRRRIRHYAAPDLLLIDEVGYLSYSNRHADLLFELISRRYEHKSTVITTNRAFKEWAEVFPNAACTVSLIDRLVHRCEVVAIQGESYRLKEAKARAALKARAAPPGQAQGGQVVTRRGAAPPAIPQRGAAMPMTLPTDWSPEQAVAVFEILDELRERVWAVYGLRIQQVLRGQQRTAAHDAADDIDEADVPF